MEVGEWVAGLEPPPLWLVRLSDEDITPGLQVAKCDDSLEQFKLKCLIRELFVEAVAKMRLAARLMRAVKLHYLLC